MKKKTLKRKLKTLEQKLYVMQHTTSQFRHEATGELKTLEEIINGHNLQLDDLRTRVRVLEESH